MLEKAVIVKSLNKDFFAQMYFLRHLKSLKIVQAMHLQLIYKENKGAAKQKLGGVRKKGGAKKRGVHAPRAPPCVRP